VIGAIFLGWGAGGRDVLNGELFHCMRNESKQDCVELLKIPPIL